MITFTPRKQAPSNQQQTLRNYHWRSAWNQQRALLRCFSYYTLIIYSLPSLFADVACLLHSKRIDRAIAHCSLCFQLHYDFVWLSAIPVFFKDIDTAPLSTTSCSPQKCPQYPTGSYCFSAPHSGSRPTAATKSWDTKVQGCSQVSAAYTCNQSYRKDPSSQPQFTGSWKVL